MVSLAHRGALVTALLCAAGCVHTPPRPDAQRIDRITIDGEKALKEGDIKDRILTTEASWIPSWVPFLGKVEWFDPSAWQADLRRITRYYETQGYYQARILDEAVSPTEPGHVQIRVVLEEGQPSIVKRVDLSGLAALPDQHVKTVVADLPLEVGDVFLEAEWEATKSLILNRLRALGYAEAVLDARAQVEVAQADVQARIDVSPGLRYRFGDIFVATNPGAQVPARIIADVAQPDVPPGDWYSDAALERAQARLFQLGVFSGVKVTRGAPDQEQGTVPVVIDVREAPFRTVRAGFGFSGDLIRQEVRLIGEYTNRNLGFARWFIRDSRLDRFSVRARVGWAFIPTVWGVAANDPGTKNGPTARILTEYEVPRLFGVRTLTFQSSLDLSRFLDAAYDYLGSELRVGVVWRPRTDLTIFPSLNFSAYLLNSQVSVRDNVPLAALGCPLQAACLIGAFDVTVAFDRRDDPLEPRSGFYLGFDVQAGLASTTRLLPYIRILPEARGYVSFDPERRITLAGKVRVGTLIASDDATPVVARFFTGGSAMRGFNQRRLAPHVAVPRTDAEGNPDYTNGETLPVGGNSLVEASVELRWNVWGPIIIAVFNDWGLVGRSALGRDYRPGPDGDLPSVDPPSLYSALGLGVRFLTPLGPIRLDFGFRLPFVGGPLQVQNQGNQVQYESAPRCFFGPPPSPGPLPAPYAGSPDDLCSIHLSIGEAF